MELEEEALPSSNIHCVKQNKSRIAALILSVLCGIFIIVIIILAESESSESLPREQLPIPHTRICNSKECIRSAQDIISAMNASIDPCDDFYSFACDRWNSRNLHSTWNLYNSEIGIIDDKIVSEIINYFKRNDISDEPKPVQMSRDFYESCLNQDADVRDEYDYQPVFKYLSLLGLPKIPRYLNMTGDKEDIRKYKFDWVKTDAAMNRMLGIQLFVGCNVIENVYNNTKNSILFTMPESQNTLLDYEGLTKSKMPPDLLMIENHSSYKMTLQNKANEKGMHFVIETLISEAYEEDELPLDFKDRIRNAIYAISKMSQLFKKLRQKGFSKVSSMNDYVMISVNELQNYTNNKNLNTKTPINLWKTYIHNLFTGLNISLDLDNKQEILTQPSKKDYFAAIAGVLTKVLDAKIELWAWWKATKYLVHELKNHLDRDVVQTDEEICASKTKYFMGYAVAYTLADKSFFNSTKPKVVEMWKNIKKVFESLVQQITWMNDATKQLTIEKSQAMGDFIGYPEWMIKKDLLEKYYSGIKINASNYLDNVIEIIKFKRGRQLKRLNLENNMSWAVNPLDVNAYNEQFRNDIIIPMAYINYPVFNRGLDVLNYGTLGYVLGHELTHGFDSEGKEFDKHGNIREWWSTSMADEFDLRAKCFIKQYNSFYIPEIDDFINGALTLNENLADNGGIHQSFLAYQNNKKNEDEELKLPGLEKYTNDQLFFISYANMWCDNDNVYNLNNVHPPQKYRVLGPLRNSEHFATTFNCPAGSRMNPKKKCKIW